MKRLLSTLVMMLITIAMFAQSTNNLFWSLTVKVKMDKKMEYEKKVSLFLKTHYPTLKIRAWEVLTGENTGALVFVMGPTSYKDMDVPMVSPKGEALLKADGQGLDALTESSQVTHLKRQDELSTMKADRKMKYISVNYYENVLGTWPTIQEYFRKLKDVRTKGGSKMDIDIFRTANGGINNLTAVVRHCEKLEDLDIDENMGDMYDKVNGNNSYYRAINDFFSMLKSSRSELRVLRTDLSQL